MNDFSNDWVKEVRRLRKEVARLTDDLRIANERMTGLQGKIASAILERNILQKRFDEFKASSEIFGGIFGKKN
jgi:hypothetical protein